MSEDIIKELEMLKKLISLSMESRNEEAVMEYMHSLFACDFIFFNYINNTRVIMGEEKNVGLSNCYEYQISLNAEVLGKFSMNILEKDITETQKKALGYVGDLYILMHKEKFSEDRVDKDLKQELVLDICTGNIKSREEFTIRCKLNGWDMKDNVVVVIFDLDEYKKKTVDLKESSGKIEVVKEKMFRDLRNNFLNVGMTFYYYQNSDSIIFIFEFDNNYLHNKDSVFKRVMEDSKENYGFTYTIGIGRTINNIFDTPISYTEAREAVKIGRSMLGLGMIHEYKDLELFSLLNNAVNKDILAGELMSPIRKLIEYDRENETEYYIFLKELINANWSLTRASENNYIHYNTAKYRLKKTEEIMELQTDGANARFKLELALRLYELKNMV